ncbi:MAG: NAD(P)-dependent oxidoreductase [Pseudomonadota bacterium]
MAYAFIGLGSLGGALAANLARSGAEVVVHDRERGRAAPAEAAGARWAESCAEATAGATGLITCLPSPAVSEAVLAEALPALAPGAVWIEMSTVGRDEMLRLAAIAAQSGVRTLECPVTGGVHLAGRGEITVLVGGDADLMEAHRPALEAMGDPILHLGPLGAASVIKVITNMMAFIHLLACGEGLMLARRAGVDLAAAWQAIAASSGSSFVHETEGQLILNGSYDVAFTMDLALKDLGFAMGFARDLDVPLALAAVTEQTFLKARAAYGGQAQSPQVVKLLEDALGTDLRAAGFPARLE